MGGDRSFEALLGALARAPERPLSNELPAGHRVGRYEIAELLGRGGMGAVYRARDAVLGRDVAVKVLSVRADASPVDRFRREIVALASVSHENVVRVHDAGVDDETPFVVLELVEGKTLRTRLDAGPLDGEEAMRLARQLASGLAAAHAAGVVHRDLKPENVLLDASGTAKIVDFGLARLLDDVEEPAHGLTESGTFLGTACYMAPEQVRGERGDARSDLFALGAVLFEAVTGRRAFDAPSRAEIMSAVLRDDPECDPSSTTDARSRHVLGVALRCLEKDPEKRYAAAADVLGALASEDAPAFPHRYDAPAEIPPTRWASTSGVHIAYQVVSPPGPPTLLAAAPFISNIEVMWESPYDRAWVRACAAFSHFIHYDRRGVGMSDPIAPECTIDERVDDLRSVLDAEKVERAFLLGVSEGGPVSIAFAAKYPERVRGLVLVDTFARLVTGDGYDHGAPREAYDWLVEKWVATWGTPKTLSLPLFVKSRAKDPDFVRWGNRYERQCASPGTVRRLLEVQFAIDVREHLAHVRCPVLVMHRKDDPAILVEHGRYLAENIPGATWVELEGADHVPWHGDGAPLRLLRDFVLSVGREDPGSRGRAG